MSPGSDFVSGHIELVHRRDTESSLQEDYLPIVQVL